MTTHLLAISGSLRAGSSNASLLDIAARLAPEGVETTVFDGIAALPAFSPDADLNPAPDAVARWRAALARADGLLISSPEYAHGVPGSLKNALDWVVGSNELYQKPVALLNPSPESLFAHPQLAEILRTMSADVVPEALVTIRIARRGASVDDLMADNAIVNVARAAVAALVDAISARQQLSS